MMKKKLLLLLYMFCALYGSYAFAGQMNMTTWYPPPAAAYNQVKLSNNLSVPTTTAANYCTASNVGAIYIDLATSHMDTCQGPNISNDSGISYCSNPGHPTNLYTDQNNILQQCNALGPATPYCSTAPLGTLIADSTGTFHICTANGDSIYPQQCFNTFCSYDSSTAGPHCPKYTTTPPPTPQGACPAGYQQIQVDIAGDYFEQFQTSLNTQVVSIVCCNS